MNGETDNTDQSTAETDMSTNGQSSHQPPAPLDLSTSAGAAVLQLLLKHRLHLPPIQELENYVMDGLHQEQSADNLLNVLPDIMEAVSSYLRIYPSQVKLVWQSLKPVLRDIRKRNNLHGRNIIRPKPPVCPKVPTSWTNCHGEEIKDDYAWLTDKDDPAVMRYLEQENEYALASLAHTKTLQKVLYKEFVSRLDENEESARVFLPDGYSYYTRKTAGAEYRLHCRTDKNGIEEVYLDENELAAELNQNFFHLGFMRHTPDCRLVAFGVDTTGSERHTASFKNLETGEILADKVPDCYEDFEFSTCGGYAFYIKIDAYERAYQWCRHKMGTGVEEDVILYEESDEMYCLTMTKSCNKRYLFLNSAAQITSETRFIDLSDPLDTPTVLFPRREKIQYTVEHHMFPDAEPSSQNYRGYFCVMTNESSKNLQLFRVPVPALELLKTVYKEGILPKDTEKMKEIVIDQRDFVLIEAFQVRARHLIVFERSNCMQNIRIVNLDESGSFETYHYVSFPDGGVYSVWPGSVDEEVADLSKSVLYDTNLLRYTYTSFTQPKQVMDYNMDTRLNVVVHEERVLGPGYDPVLYASKRLWATGVDGTAVPLSIVYRKDLLGMNQSNQTQSTHADSIQESDIGMETNARPLNDFPGNPLLLHGYGAYGSCIHPIFSTTRLSLLDRGFVYAVAHVRGGSDMGNGWYQEGKLAKKTNTFHDFIACAEFLIKEGYTSQDKLAIYGRSAGGLLIGSVVNMRPDLFKAALTQVPYVDVINTMFDSSIPWTAFEYEEWGNPEDEKIYRVMQGYCPYSNVIPNGTYPNMLIVGGMNDPRVAYFEPAKWTAKLRATARWNTGTNATGSANELKTADGVEDTLVSKQEQTDRLLMLKIQEAGHSGSSGQYAQFEDLAFEYAFLISILGAQFRPVSSGGKGLSLSGVDYDVYWAELDAVDGEGEDEEYDENDEDYDEEEVEEVVATPSTPLQRFSDFWKRRSARKTGGKFKQDVSVEYPKGTSPKKAFGRRSTAPLLREGRSSIAVSKDGSRRTTASHTRSSSLVKGLNRIRGLSKANESPMQSPTDDEEVISEDPSSSTDVPTDLVSGMKILSTEDETNVPNRPPPNKTANSSASGSKASLRHPMYHSEEGGRVQSTGRVYSFISKFF